MANGTKATLKQYEISQKQTYGHSEHLAKTLALQAKEQVKGASGENHPKQLVQGAQGNRGYNSDGISCTISSIGGGQGAKTGLYAFGIDKSRNNPKPINIANCIRAKEDSGVSNRKSEGTAVVIPVLTPDRLNKRQNGRRFKYDGDPMFTLTTQDRHGVGINIKEATKAGFKTAYPGDSVNLAVPGSKTRRGRVGRNTAQTLVTSCNQGVVLGSEIKIRKLTPKECFRLQGWTDEYFEKAKQFNSDSQLYKQAGNWVTVDVVKAIGEKMKSVEKMEKE